jgi:hypothetical protein
LLVVTSLVYSDLLVAPQPAHGVALAGEQLLRQQADAVDVEQRAIGIE